MVSEVMDVWMFGVLSRYLGILVGEESISRYSSKPEYSNRNLWL